MYSKILLGIDFSEPSVQAMHWALERFPEAELFLFHAIEPIATLNYLRTALGADADLAQEKTLDAKANLEQLAVEAGPRAQLLIGHGWTSDVLNQAAEAEGVDLIVIGAHKRRSTPWTETGDTSVRIANRASIPVLLWRPLQQERDKTVLAAVDLREGSAPIAATAANFAEYFGTRLLLVHCLPKGIHAYLRAANAPAKAEETQRAIEQAARTEALARVPPEVRERLEHEPQVIVLRGRPITAWILSTADTEAADLIVAGRSYAPQFPARALLGGVTGRLMRDATCSVLVLPV